MADGMDHRKRHRQNKATPKSRGSIRWDNENYDYLIKCAESEGISIAAIANRIIRRERQKVPRETFETA